MELFYKINHEDHIMSNMPNDKQNAAIGVIGGSGLYAIEGLENIEEISVSTPYGDPSEVFVSGVLNGVRVYFLSRHGRNHKFLPSEVPYQANIYAFKKLGVKYLISISAVGSMREDIPPRDMVVVDQYIDFTKHRKSTFFGQGLVGHVSMAKPTCEKLGQILFNAAQSILQDSAQKAHLGGTYICMEGPQFSSLAESNFYRSLGVDVIGMTNMPEAKLAREAQIAYASLAMSTDYDCWHSTEEAVTADMALSNMRANTENAHKILALSLAQLAKEQPTSIAHNALDMAVFSDYNTLSQNRKELLDFLKSK